MCLCTDNIESNVEVAAVRVESGNRQLESAVRHKVWLTVAVIIILISLLQFTEVF